MPTHRNLKRVENHRNSHAKVSNAMKQKKEFTTGTHDSPTVDITCGNNSALSKNNQKSQLF